MGTLSFLVSSTSISFLDFPLLGFGSFFVPAFFHTSSFLLFLRLPFNLKSVLSFPPDQTTSTRQPHSFTDALCNVNNHTTQSLTLVLTSSDCLLQYPSLVPACHRLSLNHHIIGFIGKTRLPAIV